MDKVSLINSWLEKHGLSTLPDWKEEEPGVLGPYEGKSVIDTQKGIVFMTFNFQETFRFKVEDDCLYVRLGQGGWVEASSLPHYPSALKCALEQLSQLFIYRSLDVVVSTVRNNGKVGWEFASLGGSRVYYWGSNQTTVPAQKSSSVSPKRTAQPAKPPLDPKVAQVVSALEKHGIPVNELEKLTNETVHGPFDLLFSDQLEKVGKVKIVLLGVRFYFEGPRVFMSTEGGAPVDLHLLPALKTALKVAVEREGLPVHERVEAYVVHLHELTQEVGWLFIAPTGRVELEGPEVKRVWVLERRPQHPAYQNQPQKEVESTGDDEYPSEVVEAWEDLLADVNFEDPGGSVKQGQPIVATPPQSEAPAQRAVSQTMVHPNQGKYWNQKPEPAVRQTAPKSVPVTKPVANLKKPQQRKPTSSPSGVEALLPWVIFFALGATFMLCFNGFSTALFPEFGALDRWIVSTVMGFFTALLPTLLVVKG